MKPLFLSSSDAKRLDLSRLLDPAAIAIVGASTDPLSISGQPLRFMLEAGYQGRLYPVNPNRDEVLGVKAWPNVLAVPRPCDVAVVAVSAPRVPAVLRQCGEAGIPFAVILTAGFAEIGAAGAPMQSELDAAIAASGVRVVGPNCVGVMNIATRAYSAFGAALSDASLRAGPMAIVSQSGGFGQSMMAFANAQGIGVSYVVSCGNEADLTFFDFAHYFLERDDIKVIAAYMEASVEGIGLRRLGRHALEKGKPILMLKTGNSDVSRRAASSHTGKLTGDYKLFHETFREGGFIEIPELDALADVARLVMGGKYPRGRNVGVLTGSGGWGVHIAEHCDRAGLKLPPPSAAVQERLRALQSTFASINNPIDHMANYRDQHRALACLVDDPAFDQLIVRSAAGPVAPQWTERFLEIAGRTEKPIIVSWASTPARAVDLRTKLEDAGFLCTNYASRAAHAAALFTEFAMKRSRFAQPVPAAERAAAPVPLPQLTAASGTLSEHASKDIISRYGIATAREVLLPLNEILRLHTLPLPAPLAVKLASPDIAHKTEAGAVRLGVDSLEALKRAAAEVHAAGLQYRPGARIEGISIQEMARGIEVILGAVNDPSFGPYVMVGLGGVWTELLHDVAHRFAPLGVAEAKEMIAELKGARVFEGYRGAPAADVDALAQAMVALSWLVVDHGEHITEVDINPLFVRAQGVVAADALIVLGENPSADV
ncbi:MAG: acetate--CoA ligase family protein [Burkholderiales bacterium]|nr:acetate--CoA ligase family protein [Burkholderiales bacterium]